MESGRWLDNKELGRQMTTDSYNQQSHYAKRVLDDEAVVSDLIDQGTNRWDVLLSSCALGVLGLFLA